MPNLHVLAPPLGQRNFAKQRRPGHSPHLGPGLGEAALISLLSLSTWPTARPAARSFIAQTNPFGSSLS